MSQKFVDFLLPSVTSRSMSFKQHRGVSCYIWRRGYLPTSDNQVWSKPLPSVFITEYSVFISAFLVSVVFLFNALFNLLYMISQFAILTLMVRVLFFASLHSYHCHFNSFCRVFVTPTNILKPKLSSNIILSTFSPSYSQTQPCFFGCQLMSRLN